MSNLDDHALQTSAAVSHEGENMSDERYAAGYQAAIDDVVAWLGEGQVRHRSIAAMIARHFGKEA